MDKDFKEYVMNWLGLIDEKDLDLSMDSISDGLDQVEMVMEYEKRFDCVIGDDIFDKMESMTIRDFIEKIGNHKMKK